MYSIIEKMAFNIGFYQMKYSMSLRKSYVALVLDS
jgi:hypothetical protein